jgi:hypothetical protein
MGHDMGEQDPQAFRTKVRAIFAERVGDQSERIGHTVETPLLEAIGRSFPHLQDQKLYDVAFHLSDWREDAAFLVAVALAPERFTPAEMDEGLLAFLVHAPNHVAAAAKLTGWPIADIFEVGALEGDPDQPSPTA